MPPNLDEERNTARLRALLARLRDALHSPARGSVMPPNHYRIVGYGPEDTFEPPPPRPTGDVWGFAGEPTAPAETWTAIGRAKLARPKPDLGDAARVEQGSDPGDLVVTFATGVKLLIRAPAPRWLGPSIEPTLFVVRPATVRP